MLYVTTYPLLSNRKGHHMTTICRDTQTLSATLYGVVFPAVRTMIGGTHA